MSSSPWTQLLERIQELWNQPIIPVIESNLCSDQEVSEMATQHLFEDL